MKLPGEYNASVIVTSDTCYEDPAKDTSGQYVVDQLNILNFARVTKHIVEDDKATITNCVRSTLNDVKNVLTITVGGTGLCPRDVTPEATSILYEKNCNGISTALHMASLRYSPHAALSRLTAGISGSCLIINFPGKEKACRECFACLEGFLFHALEQVKFNSEAIKLTHQEQESTRVEQQVFFKEATASEPKLIDTTTPSENLLFDIPTVSSSLFNILKLDTSPTNVPISMSPKCEPMPQVKEQPQYENAHLTIKRLLEIKSKMSETGTLPNTEVPTLGQLPIQGTEPDVPISWSPKCEPIPRAKEQPLCENVNRKITRPLETTSKVSGTETLPNTESPYTLIDYTDALGIMTSLSCTIFQGQIDVNLSSLEAAHKVLGEIIAIDLTSKTLIPPYPVSTMDGYVVNLPAGIKSFVHTITRLPAMLVKNIEEFEILQGDPIYSPSFFCYQVNTGGRVPEKNFAIVPMEKTGPLTSQDSTVPIYEIKLNQYVRAPGSDINQTDLLKAGTVIGPVELSLILSMGHKSLRVAKKPTIGVLSTGDELIEHYRDPDYYKEFNKVVDTNGPLLTSLFKIRGFPVISCGITKDEPQELSMKIHSSLKKCDILAITGGASMGSKDYVKTVIEQIGGTIHFGRVNIKPGKPAALFSLKMDGKQKFIFSLPGNPVSAYITSIVLVIPFIEHGIRNLFRSKKLPLSLNGVGEMIKVEIGAILDSQNDELYEFDGRLEFVRAKLLSNEDNRLNLTYLVTVSVKQQSSRMLNLKDCDCLVIIDPSMKNLTLAVGQTYSALRLKN